MKDRIEKLKKKRDKIDLEIKELEHENNIKEKCEAFDLIMELGDKHSLFLDVSPDRYLSGLIIKIRPPYADFNRSF